MPDWRESYDHYDYTDYYDSLNRAVSTINSHILADHYKDVNVLNLTPEDKDLLAGMRISWK